MGGSDATSERRSERITLPLGNGKCSLCVLGPLGLQLQSLECLAKLSIQGYLGRWRRGNAA
jgi:hypothetical protein